MSDLTLEDVIANALGRAMHAGIRLELGHEPCDELERELACRLIALVRSEALHDAADLAATTAADLGELADLAKFADRLRELAMEGT